jgi:hypothetical protein
LNRREYRNTVRDLFGLEDVPALELPSDPLGGHGFDNDGNALLLEARDGELYYDAATIVANTVTDSGMLHLSACEELSGADLRSCADDHLEDWLTLAFRRPADSVTIELLRTLVDDVEAYADLVDTVVTFTLTSPSFLFHYKTPNEEAEKGRADGYELADRLAYLLWSSMPDETLVAAAASDALGDPDALRAQVQRMLADPRAQRFYEDFSNLWLRLSELDGRPDADVNADLFADMREETRRFINSVMGEGQPLGTLLDADYTFVNSRLAEHYGIELPPLTRNFERVALPEDERAGLLTHGTLLAVSAREDFTDPIRRGAWVAGQITCQEPPPPPPDIPSLPPPDGGEDDQSVRDLLEEHRADPVCAACHDIIDPYGLALENYDVVGVYRAEYPNGAQIDPSGTLLDGTTFADAVELSQALGGRLGGDRFETCFAGYLTSYTMGRVLNESEECFVELAVEHARAANENFGLEDLVVSMVSTHLFVAIGGEL